jgi:hypothetical protein
VQPGIYPATRQQLIGKMDLNLFEIMVTAAFQNVFYLEKYQDDMFLFFKNYI